MHDGDGPVTVGIISAISRHFCEGCNRVRLTAKGEVVLCLGQDQRVSLAAALRAGASDADLKNIIVDAIGRKPERHRFAGRGACHPVHKMSVLGG